MPPKFCFIISKEINTRVQTNHLPYEYPREVSVVRRQTDISDVSRKSELDAGNTYHRILQMVAVVVRVQLSNFDNRVYAFDLKVAP